MRFKSILLTSAVLLAFLAPAFSQEGHNVHVKVNGLKDSLCYLANYYGEKQYLKDSTKADASGNLVFKGTEKLPGGIYMIVLPGKKYFELIIDKEQHFSVETDTLDYVKHMKVKGSTENTLFYDYLQFINARSKEIEPLRAEFESVKQDKEKADEVRKRMGVIDSAVFNYKNNLETKNPDFILTKLFNVTSEVKLPEAPKNPDGTPDSLHQFYYYKQHFFDNIDLTDSRLLYTPVFHPKLDQYFKKLTLQMPDSVIVAADFVISKIPPGTEMFKYVVWWITNSYETSNIMGMDAVFVHMAEKYYTKEKAFWADEAQLYKIQDRAKVLKPILLGKKVKNMVLTDTSNVPRALYDMKSKFTVLYFWDPDCGHCQKVTPKINDLYLEMKSKGVDVYAVCVEVEMDKWRKFIKEKDLKFTNVADPQLRNNFRHEFDLSTTPQIFLLDENKNIIAKRIEVEVLHEILTKKFQEMGMK